jgi:hypothetical protein
MRALVQDIQISFITALYLFVQLSVVNEIVTDERKTLHRGTADRYNIGSFRVFTHTHTHTHYNHTDTGISRILSRDILPTTVRPSAHKPDYIRLLEPRLVGHTNGRRRYSSIRKIQI